MKSITLSVLLIMTTYAAAGEKHLFILSGQSNMARLKPALDFTPTVEKAFGKENVIVVHQAKGGQPISRWYKDWKPKTGVAPKVTGDIYTSLMTKVKKATQGATLKTVTFLWMQGESDAKTKERATVYAASLKAMLEKLRTDLGREDMNVVIARISDFSAYRKSFAHWKVIRKALVDVAESDPHGAWIDTDDLNDGKDKAGKIIKNDLHYSVKGYRSLGKRFAEKAIALIKSQSNTAGHVEDVKKTIATPAGAQKYDLYLLIGQSNMAGRAPYTKTEAQPIPRCYLFKGKNNTIEPAKIPLNGYSTIKKRMPGKRGPGYAFAKTMLAANSSTPLLIVSNAKGGTSIRLWKKGQLFYKEAICQTKAAERHGGILKGILWHQGESDSKDAQYLDKLKTLIENLRSDLGAPNLPFVAGQIKKGTLINDQIAKLPKTVPHTAFVPSNGLTTMDGTHFDAASIKKMGAGYAKEMLKLQGKQLSPALKKVKGKN